MRALVLFGMIALGALAFAPVAQANETCLSCHEKQPRFMKNVHASIDCTQCHGKGLKHTRSPKTQKDVEAFKDPAKRAEYTALCQSCHASGKRMVFWQGSTHQRNDVSCVQCHTTHVRGKDRNIQPAKCFTCHKTVRRDMDRLAHHPVHEGKMQCSSCHNPHGSLTKALIKADSVNEQCLSCHAEKRGPFRFAHPPVEENCLNCHKPHGSRTPRLLTENVRNLCQSCHNYARHSAPGISGAGGQVDPGSGSGAMTRRASCLSCHGDVHGSNTSFNFR